jgi:hypothetical protein
MIMEKQDWASDIYWYSVIKNILSKNKQYFFPIEIWEKMKDEYGYSYPLDRVEKELLNLQRVGYALPIYKRGKQVWMYPTDEKLLKLERNSMIDTEIVDALTTLNRLPTEQELNHRINSSIDHQLVQKRLNQMIKMIDRIDTIIKKSSPKNSLKSEEEDKERTLEMEPFCETDRQDMRFYESIINNLNGTIQDIEILTITKIIDARKKLLT